MKLLSGGLLLVVAVGVGWYLWDQHDSTFRYRLTVTADSEGKTYTGSGVIQINVHFQEFWTPSIVRRVTGDAVVIDVPGHEPVFALLTARRSVDWDAEIAFQMFKNRFPKPRSPRGDVRMLANSRETATIPPEWYPMLVAFRDIADPKSVYELRSDDLSPALGSGARVASMTIEMTGDRVTYQIERLLPWIFSISTAFDGDKYQTPGKSLANSLSQVDFRKRGI